MIIYTKKKKSIFWGLMLIITAVVLLLDGLNVVNFSVIGLTPFKLVLVVILASWLVSIIFRLKFELIFLPIGFLFMIFKSQIAKLIGHEDGDIFSNWSILLIMFLLTAGLCIVLPKKRNHIIKGRSYSCDRNFSDACGNNDLYFDASDISSISVSDVLGKTSVYFSNKEAYNGNGNIIITDIVGKVDLYIPKEWKVLSKISDNLGKVNIPRQEGEYEKTVNLVITDIIGCVDIYFE